MKRLLLLFAVMLGLTACGGGGDGGSTTATPTPLGTSVNLAPFKSVFMGTSAGMQYSFPVLFGTDSQGRAWSGSFTVVADGATTFEGLSVTKSRSLMTVQLAGGTPVSGVSTVYFKSSDGSPYKSISSTGATYTATSQVTLPATANIGDFGVFINDSGSDGTTTTSTWAINPDYNGASILVLSSVIKTGTTVTATEVQSYFLDSAGVPTKFGVNVSVNGITVNLSGSRI